MIANYVKTGFRALVRQKVPSLINALGMSLAVGCCLVVYAFFDLVLNSDTYHEHLERIIVAHKVLDNNGTPELWCETPEPFGPALADETPEVSEMCRINELSAFVRESDGDVFREGASFVDTTFFSIFSFDLKWGRKADFRGADALILSDVMAEKYFGTDNPTGRQMSLRITKKGQEYERQFTIVGVAAKQPLKSSFSFNLLVPYSCLLHLGQPDFADWKQTTEATFIKMRHAGDMPKVQAAAQRLVAAQNLADKEAPVKSFGFIPLSKIITEGALMKRSILNSAVPASLWLLGIIAAVMLLLVCFNYINIAMASAAGRLREISVRKALGSARGQIISQFLVENGLICLVALVLGLLLAHTVFLPWFKNLIGADQFAVEYADPLLWQCLAALFLVTVIGGAAYPAFYISSFKPIALFKGKIQFGERNWLRRILVGFQFVLTFVTLFLATSMLHEGDRLRDKPWGYQQSDVLVMRLPEHRPFDALKNEVLRLPNVVSAAGSAQCFGKGYNSIPVETDGNTLQINELVVGRNYLETIGLPLAAGNGFQLTGNETPENDVLVNATFKRHLGWDNAVGKMLRIGEQQYRIIGETPDFYYDAFDEKIRPVVMRLQKPEATRFLSVRIRPGTGEASKEALAGLWKQYFPNAPTDIFYQSSVFDGYFRGVDNVSNLLSATASIAILLSAFGIFGLAMLRMMRRLRELSIRRVLGANTWHFNKIIGGEFFVILFIASILGGILGISAMRASVTMFAPDQKIEALQPTVLSFFVLLFVTLAACVFHFWRAWSMNPVETLKDE